MKLLLGAILFIILSINGYYIYKTKKRLHESVLAGNVLWLFILGFVVVLVDLLNTQTCKKVWWYDAETMHFSISHVVFMHTNECMAKIRKKQKLSKIFPILSC